MQLKYSVSFLFSTLLALLNVNLSFSGPIFGITQYHGLFNDYSNFPASEPADYNNPMSLLHRSGYHQKSQNNLEGRIVGGDRAFTGEAPYQLSLMKEKHHVCGASLVESPEGYQFAVTAAHCICEKGTGNVEPVDEYSIRGGSLSKYAGQTLKVRDMVKHERFKGGYFYDIALLFFDGYFQLSDNLQPVDLPAEGEIDVTKTLIVSGWGSMHERGGSTTELQIVEVPVISNKECQEEYAQYFSEKVVIQETTICAGLEEGGKDACQGDSGGPAIGTDDKGMYLAGIVSWGKGCARKMTPGVFTRVSKYVKWIWDKVEEHQIRPEARKIKDLGVPL